MAAGGDSRPSKSENSRIRNEVVNMYKTFVSEVDPKDVLDLLIQKRVISIERKEEVMSKMTRQDRCRALLDKLFSSSNDEAFLVLRQALDEHYYWIVERIDESMSAAKEFISSGNLALSKNKEVELTRQLNEASRRITELKEEVVEYRTKNHSLQDSYDEAVKREQKFKDQLASLEYRLRLTEGEYDDDGTVNLAVKKETQTGEGSDIRLGPPLPPRRPIDSEELNKHSKETAELQTACFLLKDLEIKCSDLHLESCVGSFSETEIWKGKWKKSTDVCVKKLIGSRRSAANFFIEAQFLHRLKHPKIVQLIGISSLAQPLLIVTEYLCLGNLRDHLEDQGNTVDLRLIIDFARQIAEGMSFLAREDIVRRDLRAAIVLLASPQLVKISDFEYALDLEGRKYQEITEDMKFPIRWTAPESMFLRRYTSASDVWSFGILLYEMFTFGETPYSGKTNREVVELVHTDYRLPCPQSEKALSCPESVYLMMVRCWDKDPDARPSFQMLQKFFHEFFQVSEADIVQDTNILSRPHLVTIIKGCTAVRGMALLDGWLYVVRFGSTQVEVYEARDEFKRSKKSIIITSPGQREKFGLFRRLKKKKKKKKEHVSSGIQDIASCNRNKRLYLSDWQNTCVHSIDPVRKEVTRSWGVEPGEPWGISVTSEGNVVVSCGDSEQLCEYSSEGLLLRTIELQVIDEGPWHGLQLLGVNSWVVCHGGRYVDDGCVCVVDSEGNYVGSYEEIHLKGPSHLAVLSSNHVLVAESTRNRIILLHPTLRGPVREILNPDHGVMMPVRIHLCESSGRLVVGLVDGTVLVYQIMKVADERSAALSNYTVSL